MKQRKAINSDFNIILNVVPRSKETFTSGWVRTGDEVIIKDQEVFVVDRLKEIIKVGKVGFGLFEDFILRVGSRIPSSPS